MLSSTDRMGFGSAVRKQMISDCETRKRGSSKWRSLGHLSTGTLLCNGIRRSICSGCVVGIIVPIRIVNYCHMQPGILYIF